MAKKKKKARKRDSTRTFRLKQSWKEKFKEIIKACGLEDY